MDKTHIGQEKELLGGANVRRKSSDLLIKIGFQLFAVGDAQHAVRILLPFGQDDVFHYASRSFGQFELKRCQRGYVVLLAILFIVVIEKPHKPPGEFAASSLAFFHLLERKFTAVLGGRVVRRPGVQGGVQDAHAFELAGDEAIAFF